MTQDDRNGIGFFGSIIADRVLTIDGWPQEGTLGLIESRETLGTGGSAWNDPVNLRAIDPDLPLFACGVVGDDPLGHFAIEHLRERDIGTAHVEVVTDADTSYSIVSNSSRSGLRTHLHAKGACSRFDCRQIEAFPHRLTIAHLGYLMLLEALEQQDGSKLRAVTALELLQAKADKVAIDIVSLDHSPKRFRELIHPCLPLVDYLIINEFEASQVVGAEIRCAADDTIDGAACIAAAQELRARGVRDTVIIHFPEGALGVDATGLVFCPSFDVPRSEINCVVGAGDAFTSAVLYGFYRGRSLRDSLLLGNANARHNITSRSCTDGVVSLATLEKTMAEGSLRAPVLTV